MKFYVRDDIYGYEIIEVLANEKTVKRRVLLTLMEDMEEIGSFKEIWKRAGIEDKTMYKIEYERHESICEVVLEGLEEMKRKLSLCQTYVGKKLVKKWLKYPITRLSEIRRRRERVSYYVKRPEESEMMYQRLKKYPFKIKEEKEDYLNNVLNMMMIGAKMGILRNYPSSLTVFQILKKYVGEVDEEDMESSELKEKMREVDEKAKRHCEEKGGRLIEKEGYLCAVPNRKCKRRHVRKMTKRESYFPTKTLEVLWSQKSEWKRAYEERQEAVRRYILETYFEKKLKLEIEEMRKKIAEEDIYCTWSRMILKSKREWCSPEYSESIRMIEMYHPEVKDCVANDVIGNQQVITGYNMSGKSTLLRTVGLMGYLHQIGMYVCGLQAKLPIYQSIMGEFPRNYSEKESTFTEHIKGISRMLKMEGENLFLIDELCNSTNTEEGRQMGQIILNKLRKASISFLITTHFEHLSEQDTYHMDDYKIRRGPCSGSKAIEYCKIIHLPPFCESMGVPSSS